MKKRNKSLSKILMNMMRSVAAMLILFAAVSCEDDDTTTRDPGKFAEGVFVVNQGLFQASNASVSFIPAMSDTVQGGIYKNANNVEVLGDVFMDMVTVDTLSYLVMNNSQSLIVVNNKNFEYVTEITDGINSPRYAAVHDGLVYVTQWGNEGEVVVVDPQSNDVIDNIPAGAGPEGISIINGELWVANGGIGQDNTISVIDPSDNSVVQTIEGGDCPKELAVDADGYVWAVCSGYTDWATGESTTPFLERIDASSYEVTKQLELPAAHSQIAASPDGQTIYFGGGYGNVGVFAITYDAAQLPSTPLINETLNGLGVHPGTGDIYCAVAPSFEEPGYVSVYDANGNKVTTYEENIGIGPSNFYFTED